MFQEISEEIAQRTGVDSDTVKRVLQAFLFLLRDRSIFMVWQRVIDRGRTGQLLLSASTTNIQMEEIKFPITSRIVTLTGTVRGSVYVADDNNIEGLSSPRLPSPPKQIENRHENE